MIDYNDSIYDPLPHDHKTLVITDSNVADLYLDGLHNFLTERECNVDCVILPSGESSKSLSNVEKIYEELAEEAYSRSDYVIALGGGVITDIAGFCAATYLRGMKYISIPTTLLAMVDAAHGGKCGVDLSVGKNLVGSFYEPEHVLCDVSYLNSLPKDNFTEGMAEVIKYAFIMDKKLYDLLDKLDDESISQTDNIKKIVMKCIDDKREIVDKDMRDFGIRHILNFGHTFAHAYEKISGYSIAHGRAVAVGMTEITEMAYKKGLCEAGVYKELKKMLIKYDLPTDRSDFPKINELSEDELTGKIAETIELDKKRENDVLKVVIPVAIGSAKIIEYGELL